MADLHLIGNSHIDPVWLWRWQDGFSEILATWRSALDRMNDFPDFKFTSACAVYYQWVEKIDPKMFEEIRQRVQEGRWDITGGWFLQPDCNIPCGESFARQGLIGQRYFKEKFGVTAHTGYNVDSFGHNASLPQILKKSGMDYYVFLRPQPHESERKADLFSWESSDGSRVITHRLLKYYGLHLEHLDYFEELRDKVNADGRDYMAFFGVGNHGGGPTIKLIEEINKLNIPNKIYSTPDLFFEGADENTLPVVKDELQHHARGCYSVSTFVKMSNRRCENNLLDAEKFCSLANYLAGTKYPKKKITKAWKNLLFNQFHDILAGCAVKKAYEDAGYLYGETMSITEQAINFALQSISRRIDTLGQETLPAYKTKNDYRTWLHEVLGTPFVVFNPHTWPVKLPVEINAVALKVTDEEGKEIPFQIVRGDYANNANNISYDDRYHTIFQAEVGALGYATYRVFIEKSTTEAFEKEVCYTNLMESMTEVGCSNTAYVLENACIRVEFSKTTGDICRLYDKRLEELIIDGECSAILLDETDCDTWAHDKEYLGEEAGRFTTPQFSVIEDGLVRTTLRVTTRFHESVLQRDYTIMPGSDVLMVKTKVDFREKHRTLKFVFPAAGEEILSSIPYGTISRKKGLGEEPCGSWLAAGRLCVANDSKHGYDTTAQEMRLTILRSAIYADHFGRRDDFCEFMEQGIHEFVYSVFPYTGSCQAQMRAEELNSNLRVVVESFHKGDLPERMSCFDQKGEHAIVTAIKQAEDDDAFVIRFCEMDGEEEAFSVSLFEKEIAVHVSHNEIKTVKTSGEEVNLIEW